MATFIVKNLKEFFFETYISSLQGQSSSENFLQGGLKSQHARQHRVRELTISTNEKPCFTSDN